MEIPKWPNIGCDILKVFKSSVSLPSRDEILLGKVDDIKNIYLKNNNETIVVKKIQNTLEAENCNFHETPVTFS